MKTLAESREEWPKEHVLGHRSRVFAAMGETNAQAGRLGRSAGPCHVAARGVFPQTAVLIAGMIAQQPGGNTDIQPLSWWLRHKSRSAQTRVVDCARRNWGGVLGPPLRSQAPPATGIGINLSLNCQPCR